MNGFSSEQIDLAFEPSPPRRQGSAALFRLDGGGSTPSEIGGAGCDPGAGTPATSLGLKRLREGQVGGALASFAH